MLLCYGAGGDRFCFQGNSSQARSLLLLKVELERAREFGTFFLFSTRSFEFVRSLARLFVVRANVRWLDERKAKEMRSPERIAATAAADQLFLLARLCHSICVVAAVK